MVHWTYHTLQHRKFFFINFCWHIFAWKILFIYFIACLNFSDGAQLQLLLCIILITCLPKDTQRHHPLFLKIENQLHLIQVFTSNFVPFFCTFL